MTFKVEFTFNTLAELQEFVSASKLVDDVTTPTATSEVAQPEAPTNKKTLAKTTKGPKADPLPEGEKMPNFIGKGKTIAGEKEPVAEKAAPKEPEVTYEMVGRATADAVKAAGQNAPVKALLAEFGVEHAKFLKEEQWADYIRGCGDIIKASANDDLA